MKKETGMKIGKNSLPGSTKLISPYLRSRMPKQIKAPVERPQPMDGVNSGAKNPIDSMTPGIKIVEPKPLRRAAASKATINHLDDVVRLQPDEPMSKKKIIDLYGEQSQKLLPLVLAKCECAIHLKSPNEHLLNHPLFMDGALVFSLATKRPTYDDSSFDDEQKKLISIFISLPYAFLAVHPTTKEISNFGHKSSLSELDEVGSSALNAVLKTQRFGAQTETDGVYEMIVAAMYYAGKNVKQDKEYAKALFAQESDRESPYAHADALMLCLGPNNLQVIRALVELGADPYQEDEQGDSFLDKVGGGRIRAGIQDLLDLESSDSSEVF